MLTHLKASVSRFLFDLPGITYYPKNTLIQEKLFKIALKEIGVNTFAAKVDHGACKNYYKSKEFNLIFPKVNVVTALGLSKVKEYSYSFQGIYTEKRAWVKDFEDADRSLVNFTDRGRSQKKTYSYFKHAIDLEYYSLLSKSEFTLCPEGDFAWTYRFFEAIMCGSIPVVDVEDETMQPYTYYTRDQQHVFKPEIANANLAIFLKRNVFLNKDHFQNYDKIINA